MTNEKVVISACYSQIRNDSTDDSTFCLSFAWREMYPTFPFQKVSTNSSKTVTVKTASAFQSYLRCQIMRPDLPYKCDWYKPGRVETDYTSDSAAF